MTLRGQLTAHSKGDRLRTFWWLFRLRNRCKSRLLGDILSFLLNRMAHRHGGYIGRGAVFLGEPTMPHGLHGVFISRYATVGRDCRIYQNVTIGEVDCKAPTIGDHCLIGAGAILVGGITVGDHVKIGAGAVVNTDIPARCTVVAQAPRVLYRG